MDIVVYGPLRSAVGGKRTTMEADGETIGDVLQAFVEAYPKTTELLYTAEGALRPSVRVMCDGEPVDPDDQYPAGGEVALFPAVQGG